MLLPLAPSFAGRRLTPDTGGTATSRLACPVKATMISARPNNPMASGTKPMPSSSWGIPKVNRGWPVVTSRPTAPSSRPATTIAIALRRLPCASTIAATRPHAIRAA